MNNSDQTFATIPESFAQVINEYNANASVGEYALERQSRSLILSDEVYNTLILDLAGGENMYASVTAPGGGWVDWYLCRYHGELYFVFVSLNANRTITARRTDRREIDSLVLRNGSGSRPMGLVTPAPVSVSSSIGSNLFDELQNEDSYTTPTRPTPTRLFAGSDGEDCECESANPPQHPPQVQRLNSRAQMVETPSNPFVTPERVGVRGLVLFPEGDEESGFECGSVCESEPESESEYESEDAGSEYMEESECGSECESDDGEDLPLDSDDQEVVLEAWDNVLFEPRPVRQTRFYNPDEEQGLPGSGPGGDYYDRGFDPDSRSKRHCRR